MFHMPVLPFESQFLLIRFRRKLFLGLQIYIDRIGFLYGGKGIEGICND